MILKHIVLKDTKVVAEKTEKKKKFKKYLKSTKCKSSQNILHINDVSLLLG